MLTLISSNLKEEDGIGHFRVSLFMAYMFVDVVCSIFLDFNCNLGAL